MNPDFSQRPFAAGSLFGVRSFRLTPDGVLTGVVHRKPWAPGVNEAACSRSSTSVALANMAAMVSQLGVSTAELAWTMNEISCRMAGKVNLRKRPRSQPKPAPLTLDPEPHQAGTLGCTCGFYAYFDEGHNPHHGDGNVLGIVEGFGVCTTGTRGFRSSKARLRALIFDQAFVEDPCRTLPLESDIRANYPDVPIFRTLRAALAEFPLTPVEGAKRSTELPFRMAPFSLAGRGFGRAVTYTMQVDTSEFDRAMQSLLRAYSNSGGLTAPGGDESARDRALRLRRERNTGPRNPRGLDGRRRR